MQKVNGQKVLSALKERNVSTGCLKCGNTAMKMVDDVKTFEQSASEEPALLATIACTTCGHIDQFNLAALGGTELLEE